MGTPRSPLRNNDGRWRKPAPLAAIFTAAAFYYTPMACLAQSSMSPHNPPQTFKGTALRLYFLLFFCVTFPMLLTSSLLLWKRRHAYPIVGRGAPFLLVSSIIFILASPFQSMLLVVWPDGVPCGIFFIQLLFLLCKSAVAVTRGWVLVYQLEIINFHREVQWRQAKMSIQQKFSDQLLAFQQQQLLLIQESPSSLSAGAQRRSSPTGRSTPPSSAIHAVAVREKIEFTLPSIPGYAYITTRRNAELGAIGRFVTVGFCITLITMACIANFDPDVSLTDKFLRDRNLLSPLDTTGSQFSSDNFLNAPICLTYSVKVLVLLGVFFILVTPTVAWIIYRLRVNKKRQATRFAEQRELYQLLNEASAAAHAAHKASLAATAQKQNPDAAPHRIPHDILDSSECRALNHSIHADYEEDGIWREMIVRIFAVLFGLGLHFPIQAYQPGLAVHLQQVGFFVMFCFSILRPVQQSYESGKSHSDHLRDLQLAKDASPTRKLHEVPGSSKTFAVWPAVHSVSSHSKNQIVPVMSEENNSSSFEVRQLPSHRRPLYSLKHILQHNPGSTAYLHFLQGEHASEYVLFWRECAAFEHAARKLERSVPHWNHCSDAESSISPNAKSQHGRGASWSMKAIRVSTASRNETPSPPRSPASVMPSSASINGFQIKGQIIKPKRSRSSPNLNLRSLMGNVTVTSSSSSAAGTPALASSDSDKTMKLQLRGNGLSNPSSPNFQPDQQNVGAALPALTIHPSQVELSKRLKVILPANNPGAAAGHGIGPSLKEEANRLKQWAFKIDQEFLATSAMYAIHVPPDFLEQLRIQLHKLQWWDPLNRKPAADQEGAMFEESSYPSSPPTQLSTLFARLQSHIYMYLKSDSFRRFVMHAGFQLLTQDADRMEGLKIERLHQHQLQMHQYQQMVQQQQQLLLQQQRQEQLRQPQMPTFHVESETGDFRPLSSHAVTIRRSLDGETLQLPMPPVLGSSKSDGSNSTTAEHLSLIPTLVTITPTPGPVVKLSRSHRSTGTGSTKELRVKVLKSLFVQNALERKASPSVSPNSTPTSNPTQTNELDPQPDWGLPVAPLNSSSDSILAISPSSTEPN